MRLRVREVGERELSPFPQVYILNNLTSSDFLKVLNRLATKL